MIGRIGRSGDLGPSPGPEGGVAPRATVVTISVVFACAPFGVTIVGLNVNVVCIGNPDTLNETGFVNPLAVGVTMI